MAIRPGAWVRVCSMIPASPRGHIAICPYKRVENGLLGRWRCRSVELERIPREDDGAVLADVQEQAGGEVAGQQA